MTLYKRITVTAIAVVAIAIAAAGASLAGAPPRHVVGGDEIQARMTQQIGQADADRQAIQTMLLRPDVRKIAASAGLDLERANAAASVLSGPELRTLAAQARTVNATLVGGDSTIVLSATGLIIILLILILLT